MQAMLICFLHMKNINALYVANIFLNCYLPVNFTYSVFSFAVFLVIRALKPPALSLEH